ncbi:hypothetical protein P170DRAFT_409879 [Aspergillus steynii IBT 23096]|uniref:Cupin type-1 domain-containing protein n=1 Tax=Aspergillus steynii IBT 23096 TaxID=1392250 RepID=A0A2I2G464_9EURO|nr:uncharacterized protein P170DRAFT_409879 [Aspergillus steynii IBT 23096]PLB47661.1 hypothetical protein P170DRAFT_409879 [Aspergillus steynii IBT 23096]
MTSQIIAYDIKPTKLIPNSPKPLLLYKNCFLRDDRTVDATLAYDTFKKNGWDAQWVTTYGHYQRSHYHPATHEVMVVLSGPGRIRWGTADLDENPHNHTYGKGSENGALYVDVNAGDLFVIPAGVTHKSFDVNAKIPDPTCLTGGGAHRIEAEDPRTFVGELQVSGFTMMGAYPRGTSWGWAEGGAHVGRYESVWSVRNEDLDPVLGEKGGINDYWNRRNVSL